MNDCFLFYTINVKNKKLVLMELGVGFNTPGIIRFPFEQLALMNHNIMLIRINDKYIDTIYALQNQVICLKEDCALAIANMSK